MKKQSLLLVMMLLPMVASAYDIAVENADGVTIYYNYINDGKELGVTYLKKIYDENRNTYVGSITIPEEVTYMNRTRKVSSIEEAAFAGCRDLTQLSIPNNVTSIGKQAFYGCSFNSFVIPNGLTSIGGGAFMYCSKMVDVTIPNSVIEIGGGAFYGCSALTGVHISSIENWCKIQFDMKNVGTNPLFYAHHLFLNGEEVKDVIIPNNITSINDGVFDGCSELSSVVIPDEVTSIGDCSFRECKNLISITLPEKITSIGNAAFDGCLNLTSINIPHNVKNIGGSAFSRCESLNNIKIPDNITEIKSSTFYYCKSLTSITLPKGLTIIDTQAFGDCSSLTDVNIPKNVTSIGQFAFQNCTSLKSINLPKKITSIGMYAFQYVNLTTITSMIENPFQIKWDLSNSYGHVFSENTIMNATLYVPKGTISKYKETEGWKDFIFIEELTGEPCATPTISYDNGNLIFNCETEGAICQYSITDTDIKTGRGNEVQLTATYTISVYATKVGCENSETATATLCWIDVEPKTEGIENNVAQVMANAVLIQSENGKITVNGADDGTNVSVYGTNGVLSGTAISNNGNAVVNTHLQMGSVAIVKIGEKSVKVIIR